MSRKAEEKFRVERVAVSTDYKPDGCWTSWTAEKADGGGLTFDEARLLTVLLQEQVMKLVMLPATVRQAVTNADMLTAWKWIEERFDGIVLSAEKRCSDGNGAAEKE